MRIGFGAVAGALLLALVGVASGADATKADAKKPAKKKLLVITESKGFVHSVVKRGPKGELCLVEKTLIDIGNKSGDFEATCTQDARSAITAENLKNYDAVFFYTTGELPLSDTQKADLLTFVRNGGGFAGSHCATDTFYKWPEYGKMIGGYFDGHPWHTKVTVVVEDKKHPSTKHLGDSFEITDELYQFKAPYDRNDLHILMRIEPKWVADRRAEEAKNLEAKKSSLQQQIAKLEDDKNTPAEEKKKKLEDLKKQLANVKPSIHRTDNDHALSWTHEYGKGRVFYTALGHREQVWEDERFQKHMLGGLRYVMRLEDADAKPSGALPNTK